MIKKKEKNVQAATPTDKIQNNLQPDEDTLGQKVKEAKSNTVVPKAVSPIQIPQKVLDQAEAFGIDLNQIVNWAKNVEARFSEIEKWSQDVSKLVSDLQPLVTVSQQIAQQQTAQPPSETKPNSGGIASVLNSPLLQLLPSLLGNQSNPLTEALQQKIIESGLKQMTAGTTLLEAMQRKILSDMGAKIATEATGT